MNPVKKSERAATKRTRAKRIRSERKAPRVRAGTTCSECQVSSRHEAWCKRSE